LNNDGEDFELMRRLKRWGRIAIIPVPILTSSDVGCKRSYKTTLIDQLAPAHLLGVSRKLSVGMGGANFKLNLRQELK